MLPYIPAIAIALLLLLAIPVYLPRVAAALSLLIVGLAVFLLAKPTAPITPDKFNWGLDVPLGIGLVLYAALWIGTAISSLRARDSRRRAPVLDQRGLHEIRRAAAV